METANLYAYIPMQSGLYSLKFVIMHTRVRLWVLFFANSRAVKISSAKFIAQWHVAPLWTRNFPA